MTDAVKVIFEVVKSIQPVDDIEQEHVDEVIEWIANTNDIFRTAKPATPYKHLVSYLVVYDAIAEKIMLIDHIKADAWLPAGGHVEPGENPKNTVEREAYEELRLNASFEVVGERPLFITVTETKPPDVHIDVSLWYVISGDSTKEFVFDASEMRGYKWFDIDEVMKMDNKLLDPHMKRFIYKLYGTLNSMAN